MESGIRVFSGDNTYHSHKAYIDARDELKKKGPLVVLRDEDLTERAFGEALQGATLFGEMPAVAAERLTAFTGNAADILIAAMMGAIERKACRLVVWEDKSLNMRTKIGKFLAKHATREDTFLLPSKPWERSSWAEQNISRIAITMGCKIEPAAVTLLVRHAGQDLWRLTNELQKLMLYSAGRAITPSDVRELVPQSEFNVFAVVQALASGNTTTAVRELTAVRRAGEDPRGILALTIRDVRMALIVRDRMDRKLPVTPDELMPELGLKGNQVFVVRKVVDAARTTSTSQLRRLFNRLVVLQYALNTGRAEVGDVLDSLALSR